MVFQLSQTNLALMALSLTQLVDSMSYMVVAPSLIFYVTQCGGTKEDYGFIMSAFSFASFCGKPILAGWTDATNNQFRPPFLTSLTIATLGGFLYFYASTFQEKSARMALALVLAGRVLGGFGAANQALGFAYIASVVPSEKQTRTSSLLSMTRIVGMAAAPGINVFLKNVDTSISIGSTNIKIDSLNAVGLFLVLANLLALTTFFFFLNEPGKKVMKSASSGALNDDPQEFVEGSKWDFVKGILTIEIMLPLFTLLVVNSNFQLIETAFAPAAYHALGWGPVKTSAVLGGSSVLLFFCMMVVFYLSARKTRDETLVIIGSCFWIVGGILLYFLWVAGADAWHFILPTITCISGFPFIGASNRSLFTRRVDCNPALETRHATMQALLSMAASVAGFATPGLVAKYVLLHADEVDASKHHRELSPLALYPVVGSIITVVGVLYVSIFKPLPTALEPSTDDDLDGIPEGVAVQDGLPPHERTSLIGGDNGSNKRRSSIISASNKTRRSSQIILDQKICPRTEANRRFSATLMGVPQVDFPSEANRRDTIFAELAEDVAGVCGCGDNNQIHTFEERMSLI